MKNWKTNIAAAAIAVIAISTAMGWLTPEQSTTIIAALAAFGFAVAKDSNVTGGTVQQ